MKQLILCLLFTTLGISSRALAEQDKAAHKSVRPSNPTSDSQTLEQTLEQTNNQTNNPTNNPTNKQSGHKCLYINSYHQGYDWGDRIQEAALKALQGHCSVKVFYMDSKRNDTEDYGKKKGLEAKSWIESNSPDVVITADDAAVRYVLKEHFKDSALPFVFCGVNWNAEKYGLPYKNATGMLEISPVETMLKYIKEINPKVKTAVYLAGDISTEPLNYRIMSEIYEKQGVALKPAYARSMRAWARIYKFSQKSADVIIVANYAGIPDWSFEKAREIVKQDTRKMTVSDHEFMKPLVALSVTKSAEEQGQWAADVALEILKGTSPERIPVAVNRRWSVFINEDVARLGQIRFPEALSRKASRTSL